MEGYITPPVFGRALILKGIARTICPKLPINSSGFAVLIRCAHGLVTNQPTFFGTETQDDLFDEDAGIPGPIRTKCARACTGSGRGACRAEASVGTDACVALSDDLPADDELAPEDEGAQLRFRVRVRAGLG